jgi:hypothetical protein
MKTTEIINLNVTSNKQRIFVDARNERAFFTGTVQRTSIKDTENCDEQVHDHSKHVPLLHLG